MALAAFDEVNGRAYSWSYVNRRTCNTSKSVYGWYRPEMPAPMMTAVARVKS
jgi:hypothetical protein